VSLASSGAPVRRATSGGQVEPGSSRGRDRGRLAEHGPFLVLLLLGTLLRVVVQLAFSPAIIHSDAVTYLNFVTHHRLPRPDRPEGYDFLLLMPVAMVTKSVLVDAVIQHVLGVATAVLVYTLLRRRGVGRWPATLAAAPVLLDSLQLILEQTLLTDTLFTLVVVAGVAVLAWHRRPGAAAAFAGGVLLGVSATIRLVAEPLVLVGVLFCLVAAADWRKRVATAVLLSVGFLVPVGSYAAYYHHTRGVYALSQFFGKSLYLRTTTFVDCSRISIPRYEWVLCPQLPPGQRPDPRIYGWHDPATIPSLHPPAGTTKDQAMRQFALAAIRAQPGAYAGLVLRDFMLNFDVTRGDRFEHDTSHKWKFAYWARDPLSAAAVALFKTHGGDVLHARQPWAGFLVAYQRFGYLPGPLLFACMALGAAGCLAGAGTPGRRSVCLLLTLAGVGLLLVPPVTGNFNWRYQEPALALLPAAATLGWTALRDRAGSRREPAVTGR
jgi:Dolichyl-phosphate-mannose-protein mannosyltransferase